MRRTNIITKKIIILFILSGFFNLLSYVFDQLVIQSELKTRELDRKMMINKTSIETLIINIDTLSDLSFNIANSSTHYLKHLHTSMHGSESFLGKNPNSKHTWEKVFNKKEIPEKIGKNFFKKYNQMILDYNIKVDSAEKIILTFVPEASKYFLSRDLKIDPNILDTYNPYYIDDEIEKNRVYNENYRIYSKIHKTINKFDYFSYLADWKIKKLEKEYVKEFSKFYDFIDEYAKQQNKINYYILFSIISQILGILFILLLFKSIFINQIKSNA